MKNIRIICIALAIPLMLSTSCKKKIYGCTDSNAENYSPVANEDSKSCVYASEETEDVDEVIVSNIITGATWQQAGQTYMIELTWEEITHDVVNNGAVDAYISEGNGEWLSLPLTLYLDDSYSSTISVSYSVGEVVLIWEDSDLTTPMEPPSLDVKLVIHK